MMKKKNKSKFFESSPDIKAGAVCFIGTRIPIEYVRGFLFKGWSTEDILKKFPSLKYDAVEAVQEMHCINA